MKQLWFERLLRWNRKVQKLLTGRYARIDSLNRTLLLLSLILLIVNLFLSTSVVFFAAFGLWLWSNYRFFSKRIYPRANENTRFVASRQRVLTFFSTIKIRFVNRHTYRYFKCPACKQQLRAPKKRGKIKVTCSKCKEQFFKVV
ncbi:MULTISPECIES: hypothetical protein [unclassified Enterococcus]|uniref:hypothetical protein n=1 Tax=unclassified Enterococcus TaxID=2608891 RepID=UPI001CE1A2BD|nr:MULTISPECIES: hypothetical protein [unclassified Enterococcus]MCA5011654.1 hypothetical protein [Enterococcus sp. S23]MCA5014904.1 hypothetical protein [Enterococcus sp. S22(2020)]